MKTKHVCDEELRCVEEMDMRQKQEEDIGGPSMLIHTNTEQLIGGEGAVLRGGGNRSRAHYSKHTHKAGDTTSGVLLHQAKHHPRGLATLADVDVAGSFCTRLLTAATESLSSSPHTCLSNTRAVGTEWMMSVCLQIMYVPCDNPTNKDPHQCLTSIAASRLSCRTSFPCTTVLQCTCDLRSAVSSFDTRTKWALGQVPNRPVGPSHMHSMWRRAWAPGLPPYLTLGLV